MSDMKVSDISSYFPSRGIFGIMFCSCPPSQSKFLFLIHLKNKSAVGPCQENPVSNCRLAFFPPFTIHDRQRSCGLVFLVWTFWTVPNKLVNLSILRPEKWKNSYFPLFGTGSLVDHSGAKQRIKIINCHSAWKKKLRRKVKKRPRSSFLAWLLPRWTHRELPTCKMMSLAVEDTCLILSKIQNDIYYY